MCLLAMVVLNRGCSLLWLHKESLMNREKEYMGTTSFMSWKVGLLLLALVAASSATLSPTGVNYEG